ncbi:SlyX family protein [Microbulbifer salipaludis]|uniref:Protein SlyX homolog n=1 Tax=Microbulbifer salipaludis TaxID=187980 RepID=A0ABS3E7V4_9GAMM|nr:SlyX family protein [Microbulbifer salipaludis]MBN8431382.1 SlyX family protein [Microbulbifer salipaludis]
MSTDNQQPLAERIDELETRLAFQEDTLAQLNDVITVQDAQIRALVARVKEMTEKYQDLSFEVQKGMKPDEEKPPHY